jgi:hypothetical protein
MRAPLDGCDQDLIVASLRFQGVVGRMGRA